MVNDKWLMINDKWLMVNDKLNTKYQILNSIRNTNDEFQMSNVHKFISKNQSWQSSKSYKSWFGLGFLFSHGFLHL